MNLTPTGVLRVADAIYNKAQDLWVCTCIPAYKDRGIIDPQCFLCEFKGCEYELAEAVAAALDDAEDQVPDNGTSVPADG